MVISNFFLAFLMVSLQFPSIIELRLWDDRLLLLLLVSCCNMTDHVSGHKSSGVIVAGIWGSRPSVHMYLFRDFSFSNVNFVNPVHECDKLRSTSTLHQSSIRLPCNPSKFICIVLATTMYFSRVGNVLLSKRKAELEVRRESCVSFIGWKFSEIPKGLLWIFTGWSRLTMVSRTP